MLNVANVQFGGKYLVMDDTKGLLLGAVMERCVPREKVSAEHQSRVVAVHEMQHFQPNVLRFFNLSEWQMNSLYDLGVSDCLPVQLVAAEWIQEPQDSERVRLYGDKIEERRRRFVERQERRMEARRLLDEGGFDAVLLAIDPDVYTGESLVEAWRPYLRMGGALVVYASSKEALNPAFYEAFSGPHFVDVRLTESFLRPYQTAEGRLHPLMTCNGHGGFLLSMIRVSRGE